MNRSPRNATVDLESTRAPQGAQIVSPHLSGAFLGLSSSFWWCNCASSFVCPEHR